MSCGALPIDQQLWRNEMRTAELTPTAQKIDRIIKRIDEGDIKIPAFQRGYVWKQSQVIELLESVVNEYPIGSVLLWKSSDRFNSTRNIAGYKIPERDDAYPVNYVLDGQQRLASIYGVFSQLAEQESETSNYNPNLNIFEIFYDFEKKEFVAKEEVSSPAKVIHLRQLLNVTTLVSALQQLDGIYHQDAQDLASQFLNYEIPVVTIENRERADVGIIFERINSTGTRLSTLDLMTAWTWTEDFHLIDASNELMEELEEKGFGGVKHKILLQIISGIIQGTTKTKDILGLTGEQVRDNWESIKECIRKTIDFLSTDLKCGHLDFLPFHQQLICMAKFFHIIDNPKSEHLKALRQWFWKTSFSRRYSTGQTNAKMDSDIERVLSLKNGDNSAFDNYKYDVTIPTLKSTRFSKANPITRAFLLLMGQFEPVDLVKNRKVDTGKALSQYNRKEYHHVFPQAFLKNRGLAQDKIFCVINFCFLSSESNKRISRKAPSDYFFNIIPQDDYTAILNSNLLPVGRTIYQDDNYDDFLEKRANLLIAKLDELST
jgi:hypothetical protein